MALLACLVTPALAAPAPIAEPGGRVAVVVGANFAPPGRRPLLYGHRDAESLAAALISVGGFRAADVHVLRDPDADTLITDLGNAIAQLGGRQGSILYFYYSGHADEQSIYPAGRPLAFERIRSLIDGAKVSVRIGMIDACRGGSWTRAKGLVPAEPFTVQWPLGLDSEGSVLIASSSGVESAHESDALRGSFFTHHFVMGMRGGADRNGNGEVTLTEAFEYAKDRTIRDSLRSALETQHPSYAVNLRGRHDLVLAQIAAAPSAVEIAQSEGPLQLIHVDSGIQLLELPPGSRRVKVSVPPGQYLIRKQRAPGEFLIKEIAVTTGAATTVDEEQLALVGNQRLSAKAVSTVDVFAAAPGVTPAAPPTPTWVKVTTVSTLVVSAAALGAGIHFKGEVDDMDRHLDPYRRFPCPGAANPSPTCDANGRSVGALSPSDLAYRDEMTQTGKFFQWKEYAMFGAAAGFAAVGIPLLYRWIRGEQPRVETSAHARVQLLPSFAGKPGLILHSTF